MSGEAIKLIEEKIEELYNSLMNKPLRVLGIFNDFFGENKVDMQGYWSLDKFKSWMNIEPLSTYISNGNIVSMNSNDWSMYEKLSITDLPGDWAEKVANVLTSVAVKERIGNAKFNDIFILVHFPHVRVTNEHDRFVDINHLWAKVKVMYNGTMNGGFTLNRSEYTVLHISSRYMHSHVSSIPTNDFTKFQSPCTGSGPIKDTISALNRDYDEDTWNMFCLELSKYVTVESIAGRPYKYLEKLGTDNMEMGIDRFITYLSPSYYEDAFSFDKLKEFVKDFINLKKLKFNYVNGSYSIGMSLIEFIVLISNEFIKWYNDQFNKGKLTVKFTELKRKGILKECIIDNGKIYYDKGRNNANNYAQYIGKKVCMFKGREVTVNITDIAEVRNENKSIILNTHTALYILATILKVLNYRYGRSKATHEGNQLGTEVMYL
jgi:hypothetical protein|nr:MAG TPA: hypothetical protein [Crassvirales sp.]